MRNADDENIDEWWITESVGNMALAGNKNGASQWGLTPWTLGNVEMWKCCQCQFQLTMGIGELHAVCAKAYRRLKMAEMEDKVDRRLAQHDRDIIDQYCAVSKLDASFIPSIQERI